MAGKLYQAWSELLQKENGKWVWLVTYTVDGFIIQHIGSMTVRVLPHNRDFEWADIEEMFKEFPKSEVDMLIDSDLLWNGDEIWSQSAN